jgi:hypothetical protein
VPVALDIDKFRVRTLDVARMEVTWETSSPTVDALDYTFQVLRSESGEGPWDPVTEEFSDRYIFVDARVPSSDRFRQLWYKLRVRRLSDNSTKDVGPAINEPEADLVAQYIRRAEQTVFTQAIGRQVWLFPRRTFGLRCTACWDPKLSAKKSANCAACFDTGFVRGYMNPIEVWMQIDPVAKAHQLQAMQKDQQQLTTARMTFYPVAKPGDVVIEAENKRWRVVGVTPSERLRAVIKQELTLRAIQPTDIEYKLPVKLTEALRDIQPSPGRMFTNPHGLHNAIEEKTPNVFAIYPTFPDLPDED